MDEKRLDILLDSLRKYSHLMQTQPSEEVKIHLLPLIEQVSNLGIDYQWASKLRRFGCVNYLLKLIVVEDETVVDKSSAAIANLCGRSASGVVEREWKIKDCTIRIKELTFAEADLGWQTWSSGILLSRLISDQIVEIRDKEVLELGCGTGLAGILASKLGAKSILLTDYHPKVIENAQHNVNLNNCDHNTNVLAFDWTLVDQIDLDNKQFECIMAADVVYDSYHSEFIPKIINKFLKKMKGAIVYVVLPGPAFRNGIEKFEENMKFIGLLMDKEEIVYDWDGSEVEHNFYKFRFPV